MSRDLGTSFLGESNYSFSENAHNLRSLKCFKRLSSNELSTPNK